MYTYLPTLFQNIINNYSTMYFNIHISFPGKLKTKTKVDQKMKQNKNSQVERYWIDG